MQRMTKPNLNNAQAESLVQTLYHRSGKAILLPGEWDANFHIATDNGDFVLKVMHAEQETAVIDLQIQTLNHLAQQLPDIQLPRVVPLPNGDRMRAVEIDGRSHLIWLLTYIPGHLYAHTKPQSSELLYSFGQLLGQIDAASQTFTHPAADRDLKWDLAKAGWIRPYLSTITNPEQREMVTHILDRFETAVLPKLITLRQSVIHNDANDYNVLVSEPLPTPRQVVSLIDFGDMMRSQTINNLAIATAYAILGQEDPLAAAAEMVRGYHSRFMLTEQEVELLFNLVCTRLSVSVVNSSIRQQEEPDDPYIIISQQPAWDALEKLQQLHPCLAHYTFRAACGWEAVPFKTAVTQYLKRIHPAPLLDYDLQKEPIPILDLSVGSLWLGANPKAMQTPNLTKAIDDLLQETGSAVAAGGYGEARLLYANALFSDGAHPTDPRRTIHLGIDFWTAAGTAVYAPLDGIVHTVANNDSPLDYGPLLILEHETEEGRPFYTLYGHLSNSVLTTRQMGERVTKGEKIAEIGASPTNGNWPPHLHFQLILDLLEMGRDFPGVAFASQRDVWLSLSPDPNLICRIPAERFPEKRPSYTQSLNQRQQRLGGNLSLSYNKPLKIVRGWMQYLYDEDGRAYLDMYNNVPHVGHSHPRVVEAVQKQIGLLNTNTRYLHDNILQYAERLTSLLPDPLSVCYFVNSGSEANELALRLARTHTNQHDMIVMESAYHGHTSGLIDISPYKFATAGGRGPKPWIHQVPIPDDYRGEFKRDDPQAGQKYAQQVVEKIEWLKENGRKFAAFICETLPSVGGQIVLPPGYLEGVYSAVRQAGGVCIADEVQVGFGRLGTHFWGFEMQNVVPDIVVFGKPIGNGFPLAAVVTTPEIATSFDNGMEFFSTFGGNPVACAAGTAVLDVVQDENLQAHALTVGNYLLDGLRDLAQQYPIIGDVRGSGLFLGIELVKDHQMLEPATDETRILVNRLRDHGILTGTEGPFYNVVKIRPPMPFTHADAEHFLTTFAQILGEDVMK